MLYGFVSYIRSLFIIGFLIGLGYFGYIYLAHYDYKEKLNTLYFAFSSAVFITTLYYIRFWKYIVMPYSLNLHGIFSHNTLIGTRNRRTLFIDFFRKFQPIKSRKSLEQIYTNSLKRFRLIYSNFTAIDIKNYRKEKERILHFFGLIEKNFEVSIYPKGKKSVELILYKLPEYYEMDYGQMLKKKYVFLGLYEKGFLFRKFSTLDHHLVISESGGGKSNFLHQLMINFLFNKDLIEKIYMIDLKGGVELYRYTSIEVIEFVSDIQRLDSLLEEIIKDMQYIQKMMKEKGMRVHNKFTMIIFDEFGAVSSYPDKKIRDSIFQKLSLISMQGRSSKHLLFMFGQKVDNATLPSNITNNFQSRVLLKTSNDNNINIIDLKDNIRERVTAMEVQDFPKGRAIYKDGLTSEKFLVQFPFVSDELINSISSPK